MSEKRFFPYGAVEIEYLKKKDKRLGEAIDRIGPLQRTVTPNLFNALINSIIGQQISMKAANTVRDRITMALGEITPETICKISLEKLQSFGLSFRKAGYIKGIADVVLSKEFNIEELNELSDEEVCKRLSALKGLGIWTAEMLMIFSMERKNIVSWGDLAIRRGMMKLYHHKELDRKRFEVYKKRYSRYGRVDTLYFWEISQDS